MTADKSRNPGDQRLALMDPITRPGLSSASDLKALFIMIDHEWGVAAPGIVTGRRDCRQSDLAERTGARYSKRLWSCEHAKATIKRDQLIPTHGVDSGGSGMIERVSSTTTTLPPPRAFTSSATTLVR